MKKAGFGLFLLVAGCAPFFSPMTQERASSPEPPSPAQVSEASPAPSPKALLPLVEEPEEETPYLDLALRAEPIPRDAVRTSFEEEPPEQAAEASPQPAAQKSRPAPVEYDFPIVNNPQVEKYLTYYSTRGKASFNLWLSRSGRYVPMMQRIFTEEGLPTDLVYLSLVESGLNHKAYSWAKAVGPWQFIESTGNMYGLENDWWRDERRDPEKATRAAARYLRDLYERFEDWHLAVAAYNAGPGKVARAIRETGEHDFWAIREGSVLRDETREYIPKLLAAIQIAREPHKYGFDDVDYREPLDYDLVEIPSTTDLEVVAKLCNIDYDELKELNPELKRWCTPPEEKRYKLRIPAGKGEVFVQKYSLLSPADRANYKHHRIRSGDTLRALASRYGVRVDDIIRLNKIRDPRALRVGDDLILPLKEGYSRLPVDELEDDYIRSRRKTYVVRKGDSLWKIARKFDVTEKELRVWNRLGWSNHLNPGQTLMVSTPRPAAPKVRQIVYQVKPGDSLWKIGRRFKVGTRDIMDWNNLPKNHILRPGDKLTLHVNQRTRS